MRDEAPRPPEDMPDGLSRATIANFPFPVVMSDPRQDDCPIIYVNEAFTAATGYPAVEAVGRNCRFLQGEGTDPEHRAMIAKGLAAGGPVSVDIVNYRADGEAFVNRLMISALRDGSGVKVAVDGAEIVGPTGGDGGGPDGRPDGGVDGSNGGEIVYYIGLLSDVTDSAATTDAAKELRERLRELQHRVKNHLAMILAMVRLEARGKSAEDVIRLLTVRVQALSLLYDTFSSYEDGASERVPLGAYLGRVTASFLDLDARTGLRINTDMDELDVDIEDAGRLGLFVSEVLTNALRHGLADRDGGEVRVGLDVADGQATLSVSDNGAGLGDAVWPGETSVGSRIVRDLCDRINGELKVESDAGGTEIRLRFPTR